MSLLAFAADKVGGLVTSLGNKILGDKVKEVMTQRRMKRLVEDAVDRIIEQTDEYLRAENASEDHQIILITALCEKLQPLVDDPQRFFVGDLDGNKLFKQCHADGELPQAIRDEGLGQFYTVLFPQIAHFLAGSRFALIEWQAEGYREGYKRLSQIAEEIRVMNAKVSELPGSVVSAIANTAEQKAEVLLREFSQTLLNNLLLRLDLSPLRAERSLSGSLSDHFVIPRLHERQMGAEIIGEEHIILEALSTPGARRIVHGGPGIGKTTCALWLQSKLLQAPHNRLTVLFRLREVVDIEQHSLLELLRKQAGAHLRDSITVDTLRGWNEAGRLVIILDGFDEVPEIRRDAVQQWITGLAVSAGRSSVIVTSRPLQSGHLESLPPAWQQWDVLPFDEARIVEFIRRWHQHLPEGELSQTERQIDAPTLAQTFLNDPSLSSLADTPLMLGTLLFVHHRDNQLPSGRVNLYERYIAAMLGLRDSGLGIEARATKLTDTEKRKVLAHIALHFHLKGVNEVDDEVMKGLANEALAKFQYNESSDCLLPALCERTGLLQGPGAWSFMHKTISEFLVAELVCEGMIFLPDGRRLDRKELWNHRHEDPWTNVLFFWAGKSSPQELEEFLSDLIAEDGSDGPTLALALLNDQGVRLGRAAQSALALEVVRKPWEFGGSGRITLVSTGTVPASYFYQIEINNPKLRGMSRHSHLEVLHRFFHSGVLPLLAIAEAHSVHSQRLTIAALSAFEGGGHVAWDVRHLLNHVPEQALAIMMFHGLPINSTDSRKMNSELSQWIEAFPFGTNWIPFLLIGNIHVVITDDYLSNKVECINRAKSSIRLLLEWKSHPLDQSWLGASIEWKSWRDENQGFDALQEVRDAFEKGLPEQFVVTSEQRQELLTWLDELIAQRERLIIAAKGASKG